MVFEVNVSLSLRREKDVALITNALDILPLLLEDLKEAGYTCVSFNEAPDCLEDYSSWNLSPRNNKTEYELFSIFYHPMAHCKMFVYPFIESSYSHTHSLIHSKYQLTWGGGGNNDYAIHPNFADAVGARTYLLKSGEWELKTRRFSRDFLKGLREHVTSSIELDFSDLDLIVFSKIHGFYDALVCPFDELPLYLFKKRDEVTKQCARLRMGHFRQEGSDGVY
jgi:hypothetical protein